MQHHRRITAVLLLFALLALSATVAPVPSALADPRGSGNPDQSGSWQKAGVIDGGCTTTGTCTSNYVSFPPTLFEYVPHRAGMGRGRNTDVAGSHATPEGMTDRTAERRDLCPRGGPYQYWAAGQWHHGATFTYVMRRSPQGDWSRTWNGPSNWHWVFEHQDSCTSIATSTPAILAPTIPPATATLAPGGGTGTGTTPTRTPPDPILPTVTRIPTTIPTATMPPCSGNAYPLGIPMRVVQGATTYDAAQNEAPTYGPDFSALPTPGWSGYNPNVFPVARTPHSIGANRPVDLYFGVEQAAVANYDRWTIGPDDTNAGGVFTLWLIDRGLDGIASADDVTRFYADSIAEVARPATDGRWTRMTAWDLRGASVAADSRTFHKFAAGIGTRWMEQAYDRNDPTNGIPPGDFPSPSPIIAGNAMTDRSYIRFQYTPDAGQLGWGQGIGGPIHIVFTPIAGHAYDIVTRHATKNCSAFEREHTWRILRLGDDAPNIVPTIVAGTLTGGRITPNTPYSYTITAAMATSADGTNATLTTTLPDGVGYNGVISGAAPRQTGQVLTWALGTLPGNTMRSFTIRVTAASTVAPVLRAVATVASSSEDRLPPTHPSRLDNTATVDTAVITPDVEPTIVGRCAGRASSICFAGEPILYAVGYQSNNARTATGVAMTITLPAGVRIIGTPEDTARRPFVVRVTGQTVNVDLGDLAGTGDLRPGAYSRGVIQIQGIIDPATPTGSIQATVTIRTANELAADTANNTKTTVNRVPPRPTVNGSLQLRIHSDLDPLDGGSNPTDAVYPTAAGSFAWPAGEVLDFTPLVTLAPQAGGTTGYTVRQRIVAWSFVGIPEYGAGGDAWIIRSDTCVNVDQPSYPAGVPALSGCDYRYLSTAAAATERAMRTQAHLFISAAPPAQMRADVIARSPLPETPLTLVIDYLVESTITDDLTGETFAIYDIARTRGTMTVLVSRSGA